MDESIINTINRLKSDLAKLKLKLKESPITEEPMLECTGGEWYLGVLARAHKVGTGWDCRIIGIEHETKEKTIKAGKRRVQQEIINNHATRLNKKDGFVPNWKDENQTKCYIAFCYRKNEWGILQFLTTKPTGGVATSLKSAKHLKEKLNKGLITGVNVNGDI